MTQSAASSLEVSNQETKSCSARHTTESTLSTTLASFLMKALEELSEDTGTALVQMEVLNSDLLRPVVVWVDSQDSLDSLVNLDSQDSLDSLDNLDSLDKEVSVSQVSLVKEVSANQVSEDSVNQASVVKVVSANQVSEARVVSEVREVSDTVMVTDTVAGKIANLMKE